MEEASQATADDTHTTDHLHDYDHWVSKSYYTSIQPLRATHLSTRHTWNQQTSYSQADPPPTHYQNITQLTHKCSHNNTQHYPHTSHQASHSISTA